MDDTMVVKTVLKAIEDNDFDAARSMLTSDFLFSGATPEPIPADAWLGLHRQMNKAFPDFSFNATNIHPHGDVIHVSVALSGTQKNDLDLTSAGFPLLPASGKSFKLPMEETSYTVRGGKITRLSVEEVAGGGVMGMLSQLGAKVPQH